jgi:hypothetical protein
VARLTVRFGRGTLLAAAGGALVGAGYVLARVGIALEELNFLARPFAPSGHPSLIQGDGWRRGVCC